VFALALCVAVRAVLRATLGNDGCSMAPGYDKTRDQYLLNFALMLGMAIAVVHYFPPRTDIEKAVADKFPVQALTYLRDHPVPGPMLNSYGFGGYLILSGYKTFIDGRSELFEQTGVLDDYMHITLLNRARCRC